MCKILCNQIIKSIFELIIKELKLIYYYLKEVIEQLDYFGIFYR